jgi:hypothetical protein
MAMSLEQILAAWSEDCVVDESKVSAELLKVPKLHGKYVAEWARNSLLGKSKAVEYEKLRAIKHDYYTGKMSKEELDDRGWKPFLYAVNSKDAIERCLQKDEDLNKILIQKALYDETAETCKYILKELNNRTFALRAWVDHQKYLLGQ